MFSVSAVVLLSLIWFKLSITVQYFSVLAGIGIMLPLNP